MTDLPSVEDAFRASDAHLIALREQQQVAGGPCDWCAHGSGDRWYRRCHHPIVTRGHFSPHTGETVWVHPSARDVRGGICGAEGILFEPMTIGRRVAERVRRHWFPIAFYAIGAAVLSLLIVQSR